MSFWKTSCHPQADPRWPGVGRGGTCPPTSLRCQARGPTEDGVAASKSGPRDTYPRREPQKDQQKHDCNTPFIKHNCTSERGFPGVLRILQRPLWPRSSGRRAPPPLPGRSCPDSSPLIWTWQPHGHPRCDLRHGDGVPTRSPPLRSQAGCGWEVDLPGENRKPRAHGPRR